jgi:prepilin signal peptidase PulO-like enzyme (type II secretory pathway)
MRRGRSTDRRGPGKVSPAVTVLAGVIVVASSLRLGLTPYGIMAAGSLGVLVVLSVIDLQARLLPHKIVVPAIAAVLAARAVFYPERLLEAVIAALVAVAIKFAPALFNPAAMGMGTSRSRASSASPRSPR